MYFVNSNQILLFCDRNFGVTFVEGVLRQKFMYFGTLLCVFCKQLSTFRRVKLSKKSRLVFARG